MKANKNRIMLCVIAGFVLLIAIACFIVAFANRTPYYECTEYYTTQKTTGDPVRTENIEFYSYYRLYLDEDGATFKLIYKLKGENTTKTYNGFYAITEGNILMLDYKGSESSSSYADEKSGPVYYKISGNKLIRIASKTDKTEGQFQADYMRTVYQKFEKKISW